MTPSYSRLTATLVVLIGLSGVSGAVGVMNTIGGATADGLIGAWHLDGDFDDASGNGHHGTIVGSGVTAVADGVAGPAYRFGGDGAIEVQMPALSTPEYSVSIWFRTTQPGAADDFKMAIGSRSDASGDMAFQLSLGDGRPTGGLNDAMYLVWNDGVPSVNIRPERPNIDIRDGRWHAITATYSTGHQRLYVDGSLVGTASYGGPLPSAPETVTIGGFDGVGPSHHRWIGDIDEVAIYSRVLTSSEVLESYQLHRPPGEPIAAVQDPRYTTFFELGGGTRVARIEPPDGGGHNIYATNSIAISPNGTRAVVTNSGGNIEVYDLTGPLPVLLRTNIEAEYPADVDITPDSRFAIVQDPRYTTFFELGGGTRVARIEPPDGGATTVMRPTPSQSVPTAPVQSSPTAAGTSRSTT